MFSVWDVHPLTPFKYTQIELTPPREIDSRFLFSDHITPHATSINPDETTKMVPLRSFGPQDFTFTTILNYSFDPKVGSSKEMIIPRTGMLIRLDRHTLFLRQSQRKTSCWFQKHVPPHKGWNLRSNHNWDHHISHQCNDIFILKIMLNKFGFC